MEKEIIEKEFAQYQVTNIYKSQHKLLKIILRILSKILTSEHIKCDYPLDIQIMLERKANELATGVEKAKN